MPKRTSTRKQGLENIDTFKDIVCLHIVLSQGLYLPLAAAPSKAEAGSCELATAVS